VDDACVYEAESKGHTVGFVSLLRVWAVSATKSAKLIDDPRLGNGNIAAGDDRSCVPGRSLDAQEGRFTFVVGGLDWRA
jgi:hypothetical protein